MKRVPVTLRVFSLFLVVCMLLTGSRLTAAAVSFTDQDKIGSAYRESVEQMTIRGVLAGFPDGSFQPEETLTREQGAKIIAFMVLGDEVNALTCERAPFTDVAKDHWSAPYIAWSQERQILMGYGNGLFGPVDTLTGDQFAKMLLCALGLAREGNYIGMGADWYLALREDAKAAKLYAGDAAMETDKPINRQQAALMAWNAIEAADAAANPAESSSDVPVQGENETPNPGTGGGETLDPGTSGGETPDPGTGGGETPDPGTGGGETPDPGTGGGETPDPGTGGGETPDPGTGGGETPDPGTGGGETPDPGTGGGETPDPGTGGNNGSGDWGEIDP